MNGLSYRKRYHCEIIHALSKLIYIFTLWNQNSSLPSLTILPSFVCYCMDVLAWVPARALSTVSLLSPGGRLRGTMGARELRTGFQPSLDQPEEGRGTLSTGAPETHHTRKASKQVCELERRSAASWTVRFEDHRRGCWRQAACVPHPLGCQSCSVSALIVRVRTSGYSHWQPAGTASSCKRAGRCSRSSSESPPCSSGGAKNSLIRALPLHLQVTPSLLPSSLSQLHPACL